MLEVLNLFYYKVNNQYGEGYVPTGTIFFLGTFTNEKAVEDAIKADLKSEFGKSAVSLGCDDELGDRTVFEDGKPIGYYYIKWNKLGELISSELHGVDIN